MEPSNEVSANFKYSSVSMDVVHKIDNAKNSLISVKFVVFSILAILLMFACLSVIFILKFDNADSQVIFKSEQTQPATSFYSDLEVFQAEDREILHDIKTSFIPPKRILLSKIVDRTVRRKRDIEWMTTPRSSTRASPPTSKPPIDDIEDFERLHPIGEAEEGELGSETISDPIKETQSFWRDKLSPQEVREAQAQMMLKYMDLNADPCEDFFQYACGNWNKANPIPPDKAGYDTFEILRESLDLVLRDLLEEPEECYNFENTSVKLETEFYLTKNILEEKPNSTTVVNLTSDDDAIIKAKKLYMSCMKYDILQERSHTPLLNLLDSLGGWPLLDSNWNPSKFDWIRLTAQLRLYNNDILISEWVGPDIKNSDEYVIQLDQTSLGLPTREYFLQKSNSRYLEAYRIYLLKVATLLGASLESATKDVNELIEFEQELAQITAAPEERRNVTELYNRMSVGELRQNIPQIDWYYYLTTILNRKPAHSEPVVCFALQYFQNLVDLLGRTSPRTIANYLLWRFVRHRVNNLDDRFQDAKQRFYFVLFGRERAPPRWQNCVTQVNSNMGMAVGSMFVRKYFDEVSKNDTLQMTAEIQQSFREILSETSWLDNDTRKLAARKINAMRLRIGYPDFILDRAQLALRYFDVQVDSDKYFENTLSILQHLTRMEQSRLGKPVNKTLWNTAPAIVNAYYSRNKNQIMFPAGILQPPFYQRWFPRSLNYGGIGVVIGHEITHGFDDKGRLFDRDGNLQRWWKDESIEGFHKRAQCLIEQYSHYTVSEIGMQVDGVNTQGENIADNGGIKQAYRAYQKWLNAHGSENEVLPNINLTHTQLFFLNFAQIWCGAMRPEARRNKLKTAVHSPGKYRVIGTLSNSVDFAKAYNCAKGATMNPVKKCSVW